MGSIPYTTWYIYRETSQSMPRRILGVRRGLNPIWDCHLPPDGVCTLHASACAWPREAVAAPEATRFVTWNLYVFTLAGRRLGCMGPMGPRAYM